MKAAKEPSWKAKVRDHLLQRIEEEKKLLLFEAELEEILDHERLSPEQKRRILSETKQWASDELEILEWKGEIR